MEHTIILNDREYMLIHYLIKNELILSDAVIISLAKSNKDEAAARTNRDKHELMRLAKKFETEEIEKCQLNKKKITKI